MSFELAAETLSLIFLLFCRIGTAFFMLPFFGENMLPQRIRIYVCLSFCLVCYPFLEPYVQNVSLEPMKFVWLCCYETLIGFMFGAVIKILWYMLEVAGALFSHVSGLGNAMSLNPSAGIQATYIANIMLMGATLMFLAFDGHHKVLYGFIHSYNVYPVGHAWLPEDLMKVNLQAVSHMLSTGFRLSIPILLAGITFQMAAGLLNRLMTQLPVFFILMPAQIGLGLLITGLTISAVVGNFLTDFNHGIVELFKLQ